MKRKIDDKKEKQDYNRIQNPKFQFFQETSSKREITAEHIRSQGGYLYGELLGDYPA